MNVILAVLYILCIFGICSGGDYQNTLNIVETEPQQFQSVYCQIDSIPTRLFMPKECSAIKKVVIDGIELWSGGYCQLVLVHSPNRNPTFIRLFTEVTHGINDLLYQKVGKEWKNVPNDSQVPLRHTAKTTIGLIVDINFPPSNVKDVRASWYGLDVQLFVPDEQYYASEVCLVNESIWKSDGEKCVMIIVHLDNGVPFAIHLIANNYFNVTKNFYYVRDGLFKASTSQEYCDKISVVLRETRKPDQWSNRV